MSSNQALVRQMKKIFNENGGVALKEARQLIIQSNKGKDVISQSLRHFSKVTLNNTLPVFPALVVMSCKAAGGKIEQAIPFGRAIVLITGAADLHDDVIDKSTMKGPKPTVFGKFGEDAAVLAGDILLVDGVTLLYCECKKLSEVQEHKIRRLVSKAIKDISMAETFENNLRTHLDLPPKEFYKIISLKAVVPELTMKIGGLVAGADPDVIEKLGEYGKAYGIISLISDECADIFDPTELSHRLKNECAPLPLIYALQNPEYRKTLVPLLKKDLTNAGTLEKIGKLVFDTPEVNAFIEALSKNLKKKLNRLEELDKETWKELNAVTSALLSCFS